ncbi:hypothetical protein GALMADRAFT_72642 [Galerina marginata CBS 339.88]|uniref:Nuclease Le1 n=1 Tax=Galerina marginata (strain CBS 339.88) TaxID=685588 RepID=A0A067SR27_GALM3|nr:hypothetical protein GALMADRAFT_72642 [Galerina marginata CBS 339.88]
MRANTVLLSLAFGAVGVHGWGASGHHAVGFHQFLAPNALSFVQNTLGPVYNESLGPAATWADEIKSMSSFAWASNLHFVDAEGAYFHNPPTSCSVVESRDCADGRCILTAIANYTTRVVDDTLDDEQIQEALKFLGMQFIGDITQPLHVEALKLGGNQISVKCSGSTSNLHSVHTGIISRLLIEKYNNDVPTWANALVARIQTGDFSSQTASWVSCSAVTSPAGIIDCPVAWATDANAFDCSFVFDFATGQDLCTSDYFTNAVPIIETQIAKGGLRLAAWLNVLFDGATHLP